MVDDWVALDAAIDSYISARSLGRRASRKYADLWRRWEAVCADDGVDPWDAPYSAFESLWTLRREDGRLCGVGYVSNIATAVATYYTQRGLTPAHKLPENAGDWRLLVTSGGRAENRGQSPEDGAVGAAAAVPMMRADAIALLSAAQPRVAADVLAVRLLLLDGFGSRTLERLRVVDVVLADDIGDGVTVLGRHVPCDHRQRVRGVPWDCAACAVRVAVAELGPAGRFEPRLAHNARTERSRRRARSKRPRDAGPPTAWEEAGLRRVMALGAVEEKFVGVRWLRARAWVALSWSCGLRMGSDTDALARASAAPDRQRGWSIRLAGTKDDPTGAKEVVRPFDWDGGVADLLAEWSCVRDALVGTSDGPLFVALNPGLRTGTPKQVGAFASSQLTASQELAFLAGLAGVEPVFTSYSTRKGYAAQATEDGWDAEDVQEGLRHLHLTTTHTSYLPRIGAKRVVAKLVNATQAGQR